MRTALTIIILAFSSVCIADPAMRSSPKRAPLKGKVKLIRSSGYGALTEAQAREWLFNKEHYTIDSYSNTGLQLWSRSAGNGIVTDRAIFRYDSKGNLIEDDQQPRKTYKYDTTGNVIEETCHYPTHLQLTRYIYSAGQLAIKDIDSVARITYVYNDKGQKIEEKCKYYSHKDTVITKYTYYKNGNMESEATLYSFGELKTTYKYDENNNEILAEESGGRRFKTEYVYDSNGNWIRCIEDFPNDLDDEVPVKQLFIREIEYY